MKKIFWRASGSQIVQTLYAQKFDEKNDVAVNKAGKAVPDVSASKTSS